MIYQELFSDAELEKIIEEGLVYMCACPAQVADALRKIRELYRYQNGCLGNASNNAQVHSTIADAAIASHAHLQECLENILKIENWDRQTMKMPEHLRERQARELTSDSRFLDLDGQ